MRRSNWKCRVCGKRKPVTDFARRKSIQGRWFRKRVCKECCVTRVCRLCEKRKPIDDFPAVTASHGRPVHRRKCKQCRYEYEQGWKKDHPEQYKALMHAWYKENRDYAIAKSMKWTRRHREYRLAYQRAWYLENEVRLKAKQSEYAKQHPEVVKMHRINR